MAWHVHELVCAAQSGDKVVYSKYAGTEVALDDSDYVLLKVPTDCRSCQKFLTCGSSPA